MQGAKTAGWLTRGRGITRFLPVKWVLSVPACAETIFPEEHEWTAYWKRRCKITEKCFRFDSSYVLSYWKINSYSEDSILRNIDTGDVADDVNVREVETKSKFLLRERVVSGSSYSRKLVSERISTQKIFFEKPRTTTMSDGPDDSVSIYAQFVLDLGSLLHRL